MLEFERDGAAVISSVADGLLVEQLRGEFSHLDFKAGARPFSLKGTVRRLFAADGCFGRLAASIGGAKARHVRVLAFDKTPESNWSLGWHQDRVIAVKHRRDVPGFGTWTLKGGIPHVEAPLEILREMFSLRLQLDDCGRNNGALKVLPGSWRLGRVTDAELMQAAASTDVAVCETRIGDMVAMKALTIHASDAAKNPSHRRVLHVDYCCTGLPDGLEWALNA